MSDPLQLVDEWGPEKVVVVSHRRSGMKGVLVIDNTARGIGKGGTRMGPAVTVEEIARLARVMTWKWAAADMFHGGAKAGIAGDPRSPDKEAVLRAFARALSNEVPREYVLGLDMGLTEHDAAVFQDELGDRGAAVGSPPELGGVPYDQWGVTGHGVAESADAAAGLAGFSVHGSRVAIQGFGAVGAAAARRFVELGAAVVAVSTAAGAVHDEDGLDIEQLDELRRVHGDSAVLHCPGARPLAPGEELLVDCDILVPAATQDVIDAHTAGRVRARMVVEGANLPTSRTAQEALAARGVLTVPDFVANAGGIIAAGVAMDARYSPFRPDPGSIRDMVAGRIRHNTTTVLTEADRTRSLPHDAARGLAQSRVRAAMRARGRLPVGTARREGGGAAR